MPSPVQKPQHAPWLGFGHSGADDEVTLVDADLVCFCRLSSFFLDPRLCVMWLMLKRPCQLCSRFSLSLIAPHLPRLTCLNLLQIVVCGWPFFGLRMLWLHLQVLSLPPSPLLCRGQLMIHRLKLLNQRLLKRHRVVDEDDPLLLLRDHQFVGVIPPIIDGLATLDKLGEQVFLASTPSDHLGKSGWQMVWWWNHLAYQTVWFQWIW